MTYFILQLTVVQPGPGSPPLVTWPSPPPTLGDPILNGMLVVPVLSGCSIPPYNILLSLQASGRHQLLSHSTCSAAALHLPCGRVRLQLIHAQLDPKASQPRHGGHLGRN